MKNSLQVWAIAALATTAMPASAGLLGETITHECAKCGPPLLASFVAQPGGPDYVAIFDGYPGYSLDVEDQSIKVTWLQSGWTAYQIKLQFTWDPAHYVLSRADLDPSSTMGLGFSWTASSLVIDAGNVELIEGTFTRYNLTSVVPEPATSLLWLVGVAGLFGTSRWFRRATH